MFVEDGGKVTVAGAQHGEVDRQQTVSSGNGKHAWAARSWETARAGRAELGKIKGLAEGI